MTKLSFYDMAVKALRFHEEKKRQKVNVYKWPPHADELDPRLLNMNRRLRHQPQKAKPKKCHKIDQK